MRNMSYLTLVLLGAFSAAAQAAPGTALKNDRIYSQASSSSSTVGEMSKGMAVDILAKNGGWLQIKTSKTTGWVRLLSVRAGSGGSGGDGLAGIAGVAGAVTQKSDPSRVVAVAGVRGLNEEDLKGAKYDAEQISLLEKYAVSAAQAQSFADRSGLKSVQVAALPNPKSSSGSNSGSTSKSPFDVFGD